jgi:DNA-directed RNA polymerase specialized sigma24 family protein
VVQSVFRTFFRRNSEGEFRIDSSAQLWRLLVKITLRKAQAKGRHHTAALRDARAEVGGNSDEWLIHAISAEPGPEEVVILLDQIESLLKGLPVLYGQVLEARLQGHGPSEIAQSHSVSRQTIHRVLSLLQKRLES